MDYDITFYGESLGFHMKPVDKTSVWYGIANKDCAGVITKFCELPNGEMGEAEKSGKVFIGDLLIKVKGEDVLKMNFKEIMQFIQNMSRPLTLTFRSNRQVPSTYFREQKHHDLIASIYKTKGGLHKIQEDVQLTLEDYFNIKKIREEDSNVKMDEIKQKKESIRLEGEERIKEQNELKNEKEKELEEALALKRREYNRMLLEKKTARLKDEEGDLMYFACVGCRSSVEEIKHHVPNEVEGKSDIDPSPLMDLIQTIKKYEEIKQLYLFAKNCQKEENNSIDWDIWMKNIAEISVTIQSSIQESPEICICIYNILKDNVMLLEIAGRELKKRMESA